MTSDDADFQPHWLVIIELDDVVPRRDPTKPNLYVEVSSTIPTKRFDQICQSKRKHWYSGHILKLRRDLVHTHRFSNRETAKAGLKLLRDKLAADGYTVNRDSRVWRVYVLELDQSRSKDPSKRPVYVGETSVDPETRLAQHRGELLSKKGKPLTTRSTKGHVVGLLTDLAPNELYFSSAQSKQAEAAWAEHLRSLGYEVFGGH